MMRAERRRKSEVNMTTHRVHVPESALRDRRKMTAGQWLTELKIYDDGKTRAHLFAHPVTVKSAATETTTGRARFVSSPALFRHLDALTRDGHVVLAIYCRGWKLGPHGIARINHALTTPAVRKGGLNIVRHFLENQRHGKTALAGSFDALLSFLEIRPVFSPKIAQATRGLGIMSAQAKDITRKNLRDGNAVPDAS